MGVCVVWQPCFAFSFAGLLPRISSSGESLCILTLEDRVFHSPSCGFTIDRDLKACLILLKCVGFVTLPICACLWSTSTHCLLSLGLLGALRGCNSVSSQRGGGSSLCGYASLACNNQIRSYGLLVRSFQASVLNLALIILMPSGSLPK